LGISTLSVPKVAEAQLALKATFNPESGFLGVRAQDEFSDSVDRGEGSQEN